MSKMDSKEQVTKSKNEGRVAAGKRLAEWNRKNKENLLKNKEQVSSSGESSAPSGVAGDQQEPTSATSMLAGAAIVAVGIAIFFFWKRPQTSAATSPTGDRPAGNKVTVSTIAQAAPRMTPQVDLAMF